MSKGVFVIKTQTEADRLTALKGTTRYIGEQMYFGTRANKLQLDTPDYQWVPSSIPRPDDFHAWNFPGWQLHLQIKARDKRRRKQFAALRTEVQALSQPNKNKIQMAVMVEFLAEHPQFAKEKLGINIEGDELEP